MEKAKKNNIKPIQVFMMAVTYLSFALAYSFFYRGLVAQVSSKLIANVIVAALAGGIVPEIVFELGLRLYSKPLEKNIEGFDKMAFRLRLFFIGGNIATFLFSLLYYRYPFLSVWGGVLANFLILLTSLSLHLFIEVKRLKDKSKAAYIVMQAGAIFLFLFSVLTIAGALVERL